MSLSPLAAAVLVHAGILSATHLRVVPSLIDGPPTSRLDPHDPTDPLSAILLSSYDVVGGVLAGAAGGPIEVGRRFGPQRDEALVRASQGQAAQDTTTAALMAGPQALVHYGVGTYKGLRKIVETGIKTPMIYTHSLTRGFHNAPKLYGENLRAREEVFDLKSGLVVSGKVRAIPSCVFVYCVCTFG